MILEDDNIKRIAEILGETEEELLAYLQKCKDEGRLPFITI